MPIFIHVFTSVVDVSLHDVGLYVSTYEELNTR